MKFSVLLPTRNRLELLKYAVETVRRQDYDDWEIIISDNYSEENIADYVQSLKEPRIKYYRTDSFVPVTDNWNNALEKSSGDYVIMLGDDDCLMRSFFSTMSMLIDKFKYPDTIYTNALVYAYPGVMPGFPSGFLKPYGFAPFFKEAKEPFWLPKEKAAYLVHQSMNFKMLFTYNMQHSVVSRQFIQSLSYKGSFFQSPYPDFYATNVLFLKAERILICPFPFVTIGISPKSFGFYAFNQREEEGVEFLRNLADPIVIEKLRNVILSLGLKDRTSWLIAMDTIKANYGSEFKLQVNYNRYRYLQILYIYGQYYYKSQDRIIELQKQLYWWEKTLYVPFLSLAGNIKKVLPKKFIDNIINKILKIIISSPEIDISKNELSYKNILEVFEKVEPYNNSNKQEQ